jgi:hypothetical protein
MKLYLAGYNTFYAYFKEERKDVFKLTTFWDHYKSKSIDPYVYDETHLLDSGAFSTFKNPNAAINWGHYVDQYIAFINQTKSKLFFELDIDNVIGLQKVEYYREKIHDQTGIHPIPVWHSNRGWNYFKEMCIKYPYVAIGTTNSTLDGIKIRQAPTVLKKFIDTAHDVGTKIHGLGFSSTPLLKSFPFDSIDSTTWISGMKFARIQSFNGLKMQTHKIASGKRGINPQKRLKHNFEEWVKFQKYAIDHL